MSADCEHLISNEGRAVECDDEGLAYLWLAEKTPREIRYVTMTRFHDSDEVYVERDDQALSCYDGIEKVELSSDGLDIFLNAQGSSHLGGISRLTVAFGPEVKPMLGRIEKVLRILLSDGVVSVSL